MVYTFQNNSWVLKTIEGKEIARFRTRRELLKFMKENPNVGTQKEVSKAEEPSEEELEEEIDDEDEEDSQISFCCDPKNSRRKSKEDPVHSRAAC